MLSSEASFLGLVPLLRSWKQMDAITFQDTLFGVVMDWTYCLSLQKW